MCLRNSLVWSFFTLDHYHYKLELNSEYLSIVFSIAASQRVCLKAKTIYQPLFILKFELPKNLHLVLLIKFQCRLWNESYHNKSIRDLNARIAEHMEVSPLTKKKVRPKGMAAIYQLLLSNI